MTTILQILCLTMLPGEVKRSHSGFRPGCYFQAGYFVRPGLKPAFGQLTVHALTRASLRCPIFVRHLPAGPPTGCSARLCRAPAPLGRPGMAGGGGFVLLASSGFFLTIYVRRPGKCLGTWSCWATVRTRSWRLPVRRRGPASEHDLPRTAAWVSLFSF